MAYLDNSSRVNGRIVMLTIPALAFFALRMIESALSPGAPAWIDEVWPLVRFLIWISPIFVIVQVSMIVSGNAATSWQNMLCVVATAAAAFVLWQSNNFALPF